MKIGKFRFGPEVIAMRFFRLLSRIWFIPFGFYVQPILVSRKIPHPLRPRNYRDLTLNKMMFPDNVARAVIADKIAARGWVAKRIGKEHLIPIYDICDTADKLRLHDYPLPFVVKSSHASGQFRFVTSKDDFEGLNEEAEVWLSSEYNTVHEWVYRGIKPRIIVEKMVTDPQTDLIWDLKFFCFHGKAVLLENIVDRLDKQQKSFVTPDWQVVNASFEPMESSPIPDKPPNLGEAIRLAEILADEFDMIRVDFLLSGDRILFGELTNFSVGGTRVFRPASYDEFMLEEYKRLGREKVAAERNDCRDLAKALFHKQPNGEGS